MSYRERRAEVEAEQAVMDVLSEWYGHVGLRCVREVLGALNRVCDARGDDEGDTCPVCGRPGSCCAEVDRLRSPQGEDHEPGSMREGQHAFETRMHGPSPARDGTVAVEDVEKLTKALRRIAYGLEGEMGQYDAPRDDTWWGRIALDALAALGSVSTTDQHRGENDRSLREN